MRKGRQGKVHHFLVFVLAMDLFNHLLGSEGCNVDGTVGSNPFTSLVDNMFETQFLSGGAQLQSSSDGVYFAEDAGGQSNTMSAMQVWNPLT